MRQLWGSHTTKVMLVAGAIAAALVTGCAGGGVQQTGGSEALPEEPTETQPAADVGGDSSVVLLADCKGTLKTESGETTTLSEIAAGRPLVVNVWATWCPYCIEELPDFAELVAERGDSVAFAFVDLADGAKETTDGAKAWLGEHGLESLPVYFDTSDTRFAVAAFFQASVIPTTVIVNSDGEVIDHIVGKVDMAELGQKLDAIA